MKFLALVTLAVLAIPLHAQSSQAELYAMESTSVSAELTSRLDTKSAHIGDPVLARTTRDTRVSDGSRLPKGTRLTGKVTEAHATSSADKTSHLTVTIDRATLGDGTEIHLHATLTAVAVPSAGFPDASPNANFDIVGPAGSGSNTTSGGRGGGNNAIGNARAATNPMNNSNSPIDAATAVPEAPHPVASAGSPISTASTLKLRRVPVANLPGVILSSSVAATNSGSLDAANRNIALEPGTQLTLNVIATGQ